MRGGQLQAIYLGRVEEGTELSPDVLLSDRARLAGSGPNAWRGSFPGRWLAGVPRDLLTLAAALREAGLEPQAEYYESLEMQQKAPRQRR